MIRLKVVPTEIQARWFRLKKGIAALRFDEVISSYLATSSPNEDVVDVVSNEVFYLFLSVLLGFNYLTVKKLYLAYLESLEADNNLFVPGEERLFEILEFIEDELSKAGLYTRKKLIEKLTIGKFGSLEFFTGFEYEKFFRPYRYERRFLEKLGVLKPEFKVEFYQNVNKAKILEFSNSAFCKLIDRYSDKRVCVVCESQDELFALWSAARVAVEVENNKDVSESLKSANFDIWFDVPDYASALVYKLLEIARGINVRGYLKDFEILSLKVDKDNLHDILTRFKDFDLKFESSTFLEEKGIDLFEKRSKEFLKFAAEFMGSLSTEEVIVEKFEKGLASLSVLMRKFISILRRLLMSSGWQKILDEVKEGIEVKRNEVDVLALMSQHFKSKTLKRAKIPTGDKWWLFVTMPEVVNVDDVDVFVWVKPKVDVDWERQLFAASYMSQNADEFVVLTENYVPVFLWNFGREKDWENYSLNLKGQRLRGVGGVSHAVSALPKGYKSCVFANWLSSVVSVEGMWEFKDTYEPDEIGTYVHKFFEMVNKDIVKLQESGEIGAFFNNFDSLWQTWREQFVMETGIDFEWEVWSALRRWVEKFDKFDRILHVEEERVVNLAKVAEYFGESKDGLEKLVVKIRVDRVVEKEVTYRRKNLGKMIVVQDYKLRVSDEYFPQLLVYTYAFETDVFELINVQKILDRRFSDVYKRSFVSKLMENEKFQAFKKAMFDMLRYQKYDTLTLLGEEPDCARCAYRFYCWD